jgi:hypothetical protein
MKFSLKLTTRFYAKSRKYYSSEFQCPTSNTTAYITKDLWLHNAVPENFTTEFVSGLSSE